MCGRFSLGIPHSQVLQMHGYNVQVGEWIAQNDFVPRHNIAPHSHAPILRRRSADDDAGEHSDAFIMQTMKWGLVPHWSKHEDNSLNTTNARSENLVEGGGMWGSIKGRKRCAVICEGYFEWLKKGKERFPHFTKHANGNLMLLAGLYDSVVLEGSSQPLWTFTIVTTSANKEFEWLHDRQPVILSSVESLNVWLDTSSQKWTTELTKLVEPYHDEVSPLICYQVPKEVGKVGTESSTFVQPIAERKDGIQAMFARQKATSSRTSSSSHAKRKRSSSPSIGASKRRSASNEGGGTKTEKINAWEDDTGMQYTDDPETAKNVKSDVKRKSNHGGSPSTPKNSQVAVKATKVSSPKKRKTTETSAKITAFFGKV
ncbi:hypothetical protein B0H21DRAFT_733337 [Amylocystis lapponica]|nr:hypothetical protein B0H21DRAFT_733337 [Amylocystis lapponica]